MADMDNKETHNENKTDTPASATPSTTKSLNAAAAEWKPNVAAAAFVPKSNAVPGHTLKPTATAFQSNVPGPGMGMGMGVHAYGMPQQMMPGELG